MSSPPTSSSRPPIAPIAPDQGRGERRPTPEAPVGDSQPAPSPDRLRLLTDAEADIARAAIGGDPPAIAADRLLAIVGRVVATAGAALGVVRGAGDAVEFIAATGVSAALVGRRLTTASLLRERAERGAAIQRFPTSQTDAGGGDSGAVIVLETHGRPIGMLRLAAVELGDDDLAALANLAPTLARALDVVMITADERSRRERERMLAAALAMMEHPVFIVSTEGRILYANESALRDYGYEGDEITGMLLERLRAIVPGPAEQGDLYDALAERGSWSGESLHRRKNGDTFPVHVVWSLIRDDDHHEVGLVVTARDLSEDRRVEEHLRQAEKLAALGELVAGVAHEVNNPLTGISAFSQLLLEDELTDEQHESVRLIKREADRAVGVIRDLLVFARKAPAREALIDLNDLAQRTLRLRSYHLAAAGVEVVTDLADDLPGLVGDDQKLQQVVLNLVVNAEHAMQRSDRRTLRIRTWRTDDRIVIEVADTGSGMTPEIRAHIFEPFYTTKPEGAGTGLGLSVSYGIVQAHGGTIDVDSSPGVGTAFRISLPSGPAAAPPSVRTT